MTDYATARSFMVDSQVRPNKVVDPRIIKAFRTLPRERFLPAKLAARAYVDEDVMLPGGRFLIEPMVLARLIQALALKQGDRVLVVGAGAGYGAAVIESCGTLVTALEEDEALAGQGRDLLAQIAPRVVPVCGPLIEGWAASAPYDAILIEGAIEVVPSALVRQLRRPGGRLAAVRTGAGRICQGVIGETVADPTGAESITLQPVFDCATPRLPQFAREAAFIF